MASEDIESEIGLYNAGEAPLMGEFRRRFNFEAVPYDALNDRKRPLLEAIAHALSDIRYVYFGEVKVEWTMYFDEEKRTQTDELADLDNYAKLLCDSIVGPAGLLIDDSQIQSLYISWIDTRATPYFELQVRGMPDECIPKPLTLYEMPDGLFYPQPDRDPMPDGSNLSQEDIRRYLLAFLHDWLSRLTTLRREHTANLTPPGATTSDRAKARSAAFSELRGLAPILKGFPKSRVMRSHAAFPVKMLREWTTEFNFTDYLPNARRT